MLACPSPVGMEWKEGQALTWVDPPCTYLSSHHFMSKGLAHAPFHSLRCRRVRVWHTFMACRLSSKVGNLPRLPGSSYEPEPIRGSQAFSFFLPLLYSQQTEAYPESLLPSTPNTADGVFWIGLWGHSVCPTQVQHRGPFLHGMWVHTAAAPLPHQPTIWESFVG